MKETRKNDENTLNYSWEQLHGDIIDDFDNNSVNESEENEKIIEKIRRKSCHCDKCGQMSSFQKKADLLLGDFPFSTRYLQKKLERQKILQELEKEKMKNSVILSTNSLIIIFIYNLPKKNIKESPKLTSQQEKKTQLFCKIKDFLYY